jgi:S1-C subfamily serine protease
MKVKLWGIALGLVLALSIRSNYKKATATENALNQTVKIVIKMENDEGRHGQALCSGVIIGPNTILTAGHCVQTEYKILNIWVRDRDGKSQPAFIIKSVKGTDLAILGIIIPEKHWASISRYLAVGDEVRAVGHPLGNLWSTTFGHVSALNREFKGLEGSYIQFDAPINGGNSGGGLWDEYGSLVGIVTMHQTPCLFGSWSGLSLAVDIKTIEEFLK